MEAFVPGEPLPKIKYGEDTDTPGLEVSKKLSEAIRSRCTEDEALAILATLDGTPEGDDAMEASAPNPAAHLLKIDVFVHTLLAIASKTMSHSFAGIAKYVKPSHFIFFAVSSHERLSLVIILNCFFKVSLCLEEAW